MTWEIIPRLLQMTNLCNYDIINKTTREKL